MIWLVVPLGIIVLVLVLAPLVRRYGERQDPHLTWQATDELFVDPSTDRRMRVWLDPKDGSRHYVPEGGSPRTER